MKLETQKRKDCMLHASRFTFHEKGFVGLYLTIVVLVLMIGILASIGFGVLAQQKIIQNMTQGAQAYFAAESGAEDALLRLKKGLNACSPAGPPPCANTLGVGDTTAKIDISDLVGGARTITSEGDLQDRFRTVQVVYELSSTGVGFFYGAQVGDGGIQLQNSSKIIGNVFSNGNFVHESIAQASGTVQVASAGNKITGALDGGDEVLGDAYAGICENSNIAGVFYGLSQTGCTFSSFVLQSPPSPIPLPISSTDIATWKAEAEAGGPPIIGPYTRSSGTSSLGPIKIIGDMIIQNTAELVVTGTIWVTGNVTIQNSAKVRLSPGYGTTSGMIIADGVITLENNTVSSGSGQAGSYLMYLSTYPGVPSPSSALVIKNFAVADILYTTNGFVQIDNNADLREVTAYGVRLQNNAELTYEIGLGSAVFTSGPGGGWAVTSWHEIE